MNLGEYILPLPFFVALFVGLMMCYVLTPPPEIGCKHPNPDNVDDLVYHNDSGSCYKYEVDEVKCPKDKSKIKEQPIENIKCNKK